MWLHEIYCKYSHLSMLYGERSHFTGLFGSEGFIQSNCNTYLLLAQEVYQLSSTVCFFSVKANKVEMSL